MAAVPGECHPSYAPCLRHTGDWDCDPSTEDGPNYVQGQVEVHGYDEYGLDPDGDGTGCALPVETTSSTTATGP
ncbi:MAG TPA: hypothetical protein VJ804_13990 [Acidimicrobiales bacterium]|nr:hypothetical protein [Acidimicrobiales bacterium]